MKYIRLISIVFIALVCLQVVSFHLIGKQSLSKLIINNYRTYLIDRDVAPSVYHANLPFNSKQHKKLKTLFNASSLESIPKMKSYDQYYLSGHYVYTANATFKYSTYAQVYDCERYNDFIAINEGEYIWILVTWIKLKKENIGMS